MFTIRDGREHFYTWDLDRQIVVEDPSIVEVHFCNRTDECSLVVEVRDEDGIRVANVPNIILQKSFDVRVFGYDGKATRYDKVFKVKPRTRPADYVYTETEVLSIEQLEEELRKDIDERLENIVDEVISHIDIPDVEDIDLSNYYTKEEIDTALEATKDVVYLDFSYAAQENALATDEHAEIFDRILSGEQLAVYSRANPGVMTGGSVYVATEFRVSDDKIDFAAHYTDPINSPVVLSVIRHLVRKKNNRWVINRSDPDITNIATKEYVDEAIAGIEGGGAIANSKPVYLDFSALTADVRAATEEEAAIFERLYAGEQILVNIRPMGRNEYLPSGYSIVNNTVRFIYNRVSHSGSGVNTGDNRIAIDAAWYRAQRVGAGTWTVWQSSGCNNVEVTNKADFDAAVTELEDAIAAIEVSGGGSGGGANVYTLDFSDITETARDATLTESAVLDKILARENLVLYITKNNISMPVEITYRNSNSLNLNYTRVRHRTGENISLTSIFYRAQHDGTKWTLRINDYYEDLMVASQDWVRAQFDGIATAEGGAY